MKELARTLDIHVTAVHQLSRGVEQRDDKRPMMSDLRESGQLEQDADLIMLCYRESYYLERSKKKGSADDEAKAQNAKNKLELGIAKQRMGAVGTVDLYCEVSANVVRNQGAYS
jgi:replicative DNA helicase